MGGRPGDFEVHPRSPLEQGEQLEATDMHHLYNYTPYEGNLEKATATPRLMFKFGQVALELMNELNEQAYLAIYSETSCPAIFEHAAMQVKDKLLEALSVSVHPLTVRSGKKAGT